MRLPRRSWRLTSPMAGRRWLARLRWLQLERPVRPVLVVVLHILAHDAFELAVVEDQQPRERFSRTARRWRSLAASYRRLDDPDAAAAEPCETDRGSSRGSPPRSSSRRRRRRPPVRSTTSSSSRGSSPIKGSGCSTTARATPTSACSTANRGAPADSRFCSLPLRTRRGSDRGTISSPRRWGRPNDCCVPTVPDRIRASCCSPLGLGASALRIRRLSGGLTLLCTVKATRFRGCGAPAAPTRRAPRAPTGAQPGQCG